MKGNEMIRDALELPMAQDDFGYVRGTGWQSGTQDYPAWLDRKLYPFQGRWLELDGHRIHYLDEGSGPVILFLHAAPAWSFIYRNIIFALCDRFRCIALDFPGFGFSKARKDFVCTLPEMALVIEQFTSSLNLRDITLLVHDSSGAIGLKVAGKQPDLFKALILTDTFA